MRTVQGSEELKIICNNNNNSSNNLPWLRGVMSRSSKGIIVACVSCHVQKEKSDIRDVKQYSLSSLRFDAKSRGTMLRDDYEQIALQIGSTEIGSKVL